MNTEKLVKKVNKIDNIEEQLDKNMINASNYTDVISTINSAIIDRNINTDYKIYKAQLDYNGNENLTNVPIEIKINFEIGECKDVGCISINNSTRTLSFQWEGVKQTNPFMIRDISLYGDGSLKSGSIWILDDLKVGQSNIYDIYVHNQSVSKTYDKAIIKNESGSDITFTIGNVKIIFNITTKTYKYYKNDNLLSYGTNPNRTLYDAFIKDSTGTSYSCIDINSFFDTEYTISGNGTVFYEIKRIFTHKTTKAKLTIIDKILGDGTIISDIIMQPTTILTSNNIKAFGVKTAINKDVNFTYNVNRRNGEFETTFGTGEKLNYKFYNAFVVQDYSNPSQNYSSNLLSVIEDSKEIGLNCYWENADIQLNSESIFRVRLYISSTLNCHNLTNFPITFATIDTVKIGKDRLIKNMKKFIDYMTNENEFSDLFKPLKVYVNLCRGLIDGTLNLTLIDNYLTELKNKYGNCTTDGFKNTYLNGKGIEYIGRDTMPLVDIKKICSKFNINKINEINEIIHNLADFYVWCETYSGGNGKIKLKYDFPDTMNSEATAMKSLYNSLKLVENTTRRECYNRIKSHFDSQVQYNNLLPYSSDGDIIDVVRYQQQHYQAFALFEYLDAVDTLPSSFNISQTIFQNVNSCGKIDELGSEYTSIRFGFIHSSLYWACVLRKYNTPSSLECANRLVENVLSKCYATGGHMFPLDNWKLTSGGTIDQIIEVSICYNTILKHLL